MKVETELENAAWYYPEPLEKAKYIKDYVAFCKFFTPTLLSISISIPDRCMLTDF